MQFYVKPNSNCSILSLTTLADIAGGEWEAEPCWRGQPIIKTGDNLTPRQVVGWSSLFGGSAVNLAAYRRIDAHPALALVGADWGLRILANADEEVEPLPGAEHLPPGWGTALLVVYHPEDIEDADLRALLMEMMPSKKPELWICPAVAEMTAGGTFNLDELKAHAATCPTCQAITGALMKPIADVLTVWPPEPPSKDEKP